MIEFAIRTQKNSCTRTIHGADGTPIFQVIQAACRLSPGAFTPQIGGGYKTLGERP